MPFDGIWTSGIDNVIVDALVESGAPLVPVVGADNAGFVGQLNSVEGLKGAAVTNPGSVGGAGVTLALQILDGKAPAEKTVLVTPVALGERDRRRQGPAQGRRRSLAQPGMAGLDLDPGLDHLHQGPDRRLQGPRRVSSRGIDLASGRDGRSVLSLPFVRGTAISAAD